MPQILSKIKKERADTYYSFLCFLLVLLLSVFALEDYDLGFHLAAGKFMAEFGKMPLIDYFTFTRAGLPDYPHSLVSALLFYRIFQVGGFPLLIVFRGLVIAGTFLLIYFACHLREEKQIRSQLFPGILVFLAAIMARGRFHLQPFLLSDLCLAFTIFQLQRFRYRQKGIALVWLGLCFGLWFHLHLGVVQGIVVLFLFWFSLLWEGRWDLAKKFALVLGPSLLFLGVFSAWLNPSSRNMWLHLWMEMNNSSKQLYVGEYQSGWFGFSHRMGFLLGSVFVVWLACHFSRVSRKVKTSPFLFLLFVFFGILCSLYQREITHFCMAWVLLMDALYDRLKKSFWPGQLPVWGTQVVRIGVLLGVVGGLMLELRNLEFLPQLNLDPRKIPSEAYEFIATHTRAKRMYNSMQWGGWWSFFYGNETKIFHDGRGPLYDQAFFDENVKPLLSSGEGWRTIFERYQVDIALVDTGDVLCEKLRRAKDWGLIYFDDVAAVYVPMASFPDLPTFTKLDPCAEDVHYWQMDSFHQDPEFSQEIRAFAFSFPNNPRSSFIVGLYLAKKGYLLKALEMFQRSAELRPSRLDAWENVARLACGLERFAESDEAFRNASYIVATSPTFWKSWQVCLNRQGRTLESRWVGIKGRILRTYFLLK